jgi:hypothetical protein
MDTQRLLARLERLEYENGRIKRAARLTKIMVASMVVLFTAVAAIPAAHSLPFPFKIGANEFDLLASNGKVTAKLANLNGGALLAFYDANGKLVESVGFSNTAAQAGAGMSVYDGNAVLAGNGVTRAGYGYTSRGPATGIGAATWDASGDVRSSIGQALDGSIAYEQLFDTTGALRTGINVPNGANLGYFNRDANGTPRVELYESGDGLITSLSLIHQSGIEGADAIATDEPSFPSSNFATWNADHSHIASIIGTVEPADSGSVNTTAANGTLSGHLP